MFKIRDRGFRAGGTENLIVCETCYWWNYVSQNYLQNNLKLNPIVHKVVTAKEGKIVKYI